MSDGVNERFDFTQPVPPAEELGAVHFIAAGGSGMSGVARMFLASGAEVSGSDAVDSPALQALAREGVRVAVGHDPANLGAAQTVVISSAIRESNPELVAARAAGLRVLHRAQGIAALLHGRDAVAVAGANGKTTTSAMLAWALRQAGADPAYVVGSPIGGTGTNAAPGTGPFVVEADESDGSFLVYRPQVAIVTNVKPDHLDFYGTVDNLRAAYRRFAATIRPGGLLAASSDDPGAADLAEQHRDQGNRVLTFGSGPAADLQVGESVPGPDGLSTRAVLTDTRSGATHDLLVPMPGRHNVLNAAAAYLAATAGLGLEPDPVLAGLASYPGTHRRFEPVGTAGGVQIIDDYAHNPDKVAAVVQAGRAVAGPDRRLVVLFQPHLYSRTRDFAEEFAAGLAAADVVCVMDVYGAREDPVPGISGQLIIDRLTLRDFRGEARFLPQRDGTAHHVAETVRPGDLLLTVGAGDVTRVGPEVLGLLGAADRAADEPDRQGRGGS
ncbi:UDP-N-acetylmuramate--L-alanine ligase [Ornithinicoccus hortensis]|uniref:UDP-N-acetylmuramate--L-alanine ligase n=1 Tax=Ornithinicoccus hortensis TaxID=82346 RepID=A0A542YR29_9MICO|nr:UDP-N-acetylmuramate--L-alanine ligase [Ornithinicoccus hortensis]TQL50539.1 UDP-N-acetylmuramate--L-alanine ligase [Ornithinicoccus hortensis]